MKRLEVDGIFNGVPRPVAFEPLALVREYPVQWKKTRSSGAKLALGADATTIVIREAAHAQMERETS